MAFFVVRRSRELGDAHMPRVKGRNQSLDATAFAGGIPAFEHDA